MNDIPEPAAAPAVDDDLLRDLHRAAGVGSAWSTKPEEWAARLLASEPMQRYVEIKERQATAKYVEDALRIRDERDAAVRERDEAYRQKTEWQATAGRLSRDVGEARTGWTSALARAQNQANLVTDLRAKAGALGMLRDQLRADRDEVERNLAEAREVIGEVGELVDPWMGFDGSIVDGLKAVVAEVERLRAAQQLPDVGPVTRRGQEYHFGDGTSVVSHVEAEATAGEARHTAAQFLALAAYCDARDTEAADTRSDDEDPVYEVVAEILDASGWDEMTVDGIASEVSARLRARGGQEAGQ